MGIRKDLLVTEEIAESSDLRATPARLRALLKIKAPDLSNPSKPTENDQSVRVWDQLARSDAERRRMAISKDTAAEQGGKKVVRKLQRWIRLSANDRPKPARRQK